MNLTRYNKHMLDCMGTLHERQWHFQINLFFFVFFLVGLGFLRSYILHKLSNKIVMYNENDYLPFYEIRA